MSEPEPQTDQRETSVPENLSTAAFLNVIDDALADCTVSVPQQACIEIAEEDKKEDDDSAENKEEGADVAAVEKTEGKKEYAEEYKSHKVVLAAGAKFFYDQFVNQKFSEAVLTIPENPKDKWVQQNTHPRRDFSIVRQFLYNDRRWDSIKSSINVHNAFSIYVLASQLDIPVLKAKTLAFVNKNILTKSNAMKYMYMAGVCGDVCNCLREKATQKLMNNFDAAFPRKTDASADGDTSDEIFDLLKRMDANAICDLLGNSSLKTSSEGNVLKVVSKLLRARTTRDKQTIILNLKKIKLAEDGLDKDSLPAKLQVFGVVTGEGDGITSLATLDLEFKAEDEGTFSLSGLSPEGHEFPITLKKNTKNHTKMMFFRKTIFPISIFLHSKN